MRPLAMKHRRNADVVFDGDGEEEFAAQPAHETQWETDTQRIMIPEVSSHTPTASTGHKTKQRRLPVRIETQRSPAPTMQPHNIDSTPPRTPQDAFSPIPDRDSISPTQPSPETTSQTTPTTPDAISPSPRRQVVLALRGVGAMVSMEEKRHPMMATGPAGVVDGTTVIDVNTKAAALGVEPGSSAIDAVHTFPALMLAPAQFLDYRRAGDAVEKALSRLNLTPTRLDSLTFAVPINSIVNALATRSPVWAPHLATPVDLRAAIAALIDVLPIPAAAVIGTNRLSVIKRVYTAKAGEIIGSARAGRYAGNLSPPEPVPPMPVKTTRGELRQTIIQRLAHFNDVPESISWEGGAYQCSNKERALISRMLENRNHPPAESSIHSEFITIIDRISSQIPPSVEVTLTQVRPPVRSTQLDPFLAAITPIMRLGTSAIRSPQTVTPISALRVSGGRDGGRVDPAPEPHPAPARSAPGVGRVLFRTPTDVHSTRQAARASITVSQSSPLSLTRVTVLPERCAGRMRCSACGRGVLFTVESIKRHLADHQQAIARAHIRKIYVPDEKMVDDGEVVEVED